MQAKFASINGYQKDIYAAHLVAQGAATFDADRLTVTLNADASEDQRRMMSVTLEGLSAQNAAWGAITEADPAASEQQLALIKKLAVAPETRIMMWNRVELGALTRSQASRLIDCARDLIENGY